MNQMVDKPEPSLGHITALGQISVSAIRLVLIIGSGRAGSRVGRKASFKEILHQQHATQLHGDCTKVQIHSLFILFWIIPSTFWSSTDVEFGVQHFAGL